MLQGAAVTSMVCATTEHQNSRIWATDTLLPAIIQKVITPMKRIDIEVYMKRRIYHEKLQETFSRFVGVVSRCRYHRL